ncbi:MAG: penicillin-binding protein [Trueperaceae bacterium]|nr:MAG: penicillin-binding protein [Trueperaceae bacterium]
MKILQASFILLLAGVLSITSLLSASALKWAQDLPDLSELDALDFTATSQIFARDGTTLIGEIVPVVGEDRAGTNRIPVGLDDISPAALQAIIAYEDDQFFKHYGFDVPGLVRATYEEFFGEAGRGGSTITTQVIKNTVLEDIRSERSLERKAKELMLAIELERRLTKAEILQRYINVVFWGGNVYGIRAAAQAYFGKEPIELNLAEGLYLARLIPAPNERHNNFEGTRASMKEVLDRMVRQGMVSADARDRAWRYPLQPRGWRVSYDADGELLTVERTGEEAIIRTSVSSELSRHVVLAVRNWLTDRYGESLVFGRGGLRVTTTIDIQAQQAANEASRKADIPQGSQLAIVGLVPESGEVLAMVGERLQEGVESKEFNRVTQALRQPGSSFKPVVYATAIELNGFSQATVLVDEPATFVQRGEEDYEPQNWDEDFDGYQTIREHVNRSRNIPAVKALEAASPQAVADRARELGYTNIAPYYSLALGSFEVTPLQHASAFSAFANKGVQVEAHFVARVEDSDGNVLYEARPRRSQVWTEQTAYIVLDMLHGNVVDRDPTALSWRAAIEGRWVAGKTGTTNEDRDIWFVGTTPGFVAAVWIGNDDNTALPKNMTRRDGQGEIVTSSRQPIYIWRDFVENALRGTLADPEGFPVPEGIAFHTIDRKSGRPVPGGSRAAFRSDTDLRGIDSAAQLKIELPIDTRTGVRASSDTPPEHIEIVRISPSEVDAYLGRSDPGSP